MTLYAKKMLCLANSIKKHEQGEGRCVAGREVLAAGFGNWIRPVSARPSREVSDSERQCQDGTMVQVLDVVTVSLLCPQPKRHQTENHVIDRERPWVRGRKAAWRHVLAAIDTPRGPLWINGYSSRNGLNDRIPAAAAATLPRSLYLISPDSLSIIVRTEPAFNTLPKRRVRAAFSCNRIDYLWAVTDPVITDKYIRGKEGRFCIKDALLCISLGEPFNGNAYKLVATVITPDMGA
jgi:microcompartment protein CcmK/EutM